MQVTVAVGQFSPRDDKDANLEAVASLARDAGERGAALLVLPEYTAFMTGRIDERIVAAAEPLDGPFVAALARVAATHRIALVAGVNEAVPGEDRVHNTLVILDTEGALAGTYRKVHLYDAFGIRESDWIVPGEPATPATFALGPLTCGAQTCYDLRFPEVTRALADAGADVVVVPAQWVPGPLKESHWETLLRARAIENTVYVVAADQAGPHGAGRSMVLDPMGLTLADLGERTGVATAVLDRGRIDEVRARNPSLAARRYHVRPGAPPAAPTSTPAPG